MEDLRTAIGAFIAERDWEQFHSPKNLAMALSVEVAEIVEHFQWLDEEQSRSLPPEKLAEAREEIGDVMIYLTELADKLGIDPVEAAFDDVGGEDGIEKEDPDLPNVTFRLAGGGNREVDVPLRLGGVLVAVQTWVREVDPRIAEGHYRTMQRRWSAAKKKLESTDRYYTDYLLGDPAGRRHMEKRGLRCILPVLCGPFTEPVVSLEGGFWLRYPSMQSFDSPEEAIPRILTPFELKRFLSTTNEAEMIGICERHGWTL